MEIEAAAPESTTTIFYQTSDGAIQGTTGIPEDRAVVMKVTAFLDRLVLT